MQFLMAKPAPKGALREQATLRSSFRRLRDLFPKLISGAYVTLDTQNEASENAERGIFGD